MCEENNENTLNKKTLLLLGITRIVLWMFSHMPVSLQQKLLFTVPAKTCVYFAKWTH